MGYIIYAILSLKKGHKKLTQVLGTMMGIDDGGLYIIEFDQIAAVVSKTTKESLIVDKTNAVKYAGIIEKLAKDFTLIPMRYGSILESSDVTLNMLKKNNKEIEQNLQKVKNKSEFELKVFCNSEKLKSELRMKSVTTLQEQSKLVQGDKNSIYKDYIIQKLKEHKDEELILNQINNIIGDIEGHLRQFNALNKFKKMVTEMNIINAVFLLEKNKQDELFQLIKNLQYKYSDLKFILTGPWAPYNFAEIDIK